MVSNWRNACESGIDEAKTWIENKKILSIGDDLWPTVMSHVTYVNEFKRPVDCFLQANIIIHTRSSSIAPQMRGIIEVSCLEPIGIAGRKIFLAIVEIRREALKRVMVLTKT